MISIYLNSLYNLLYYNNPLMVFLAQAYKNMKNVVNMRHNMNRAQQKLSRLEHRFQAVEAYVNNSKDHGRAKFDVYR